MKHYIYISLTVLSSCLLSSCKMATVGFKIGETQTAVHLPIEVKNITVLSRTRPTNTTGWINQAVQLATTKTLGYIKPQCIEECLDGFNNKLFGGKYFGTKHSRYLDSSPSSNFPAPLTKMDIENICPECSLTVIVSLEIFQTKIDSLQPIFIEVDTKTKRKLASRHVPLLVGWRTYDYTGKILDEFKTEKILIVKAEGPLVAQDTSNKLPTYEVELNRVSKLIGEEYEQRIIPKSIIETRKYYTKGGNEMGRGKDFIKNNHWDKAKELYLKLSNSSDKKVASRALHNLAICYEREGDFNKAMELMLKSNNGGYKNNYAPYYIQELNRRLSKVNQ